MMRAIPSGGAWARSMRAGLGAAAGGLVIGLSLGLAAAPFALGREPVVPAVQVLMETGTTVIGETVAYPTGAAARVTVAIVAMPPGAQTGWHTHGVPLVGYMLDGELTVDYGPHGTRVYRRGETLMEAIEAPHNGSNRGQGPVRILAVYLGAEGVPNSAKAEPPEASREGTGR